MTQDREERQMLDALGRAVPQVAPPPGLRARVLAAATREPIDPPLPSTPAVLPTAGAPSTGDTSSTADAPVTPARPTSPIPFEARPPAAVPAALPAPARVSRAPWLLAAASAFVAIGTSLGWVSARGEVARLQSTIAELRANATALLNVRAEFDRERTDRERAAAILNASDVHSAPLAGVAPATAATGRVYVSSRGMFFTAEALPALAAGRTYQLWTIVGGQPVSHGVFGPASDGRAQVLAQTPPGPVQAIAVTIEPEGGVPAPTGDKVLLGLPAAN